MCLAIMVFIFAPLCLISCSIPYIGALLPKPLSEVSLSPWSEVILFSLNPSKIFCQVSVPPCAANDQISKIGEITECKGLDWKDLPHFQLLVDHQPDDFCFCLVEHCLDAARALILETCGDPDLVANQTESTDFDDKDDEELTLLFLFQNETFNFTEFKINSLTSSTSTTTSTTSSTPRPERTTTKTKEKSKSLIGGKWGLTVSSSNQLEVSNSS